MNRQRKSSWLTRERQGWSLLEEMLFCSVGIGAAAIAAGGSMYAADKNASSQKSAQNAANQQAQASQAIAQQQQDIANNQYEYYKTNFRPIEDQYLNEAQGLGSIANQNKNAQQAGADVASGFAGARQQLNETPGLNPNSDAYLRAENGLNLSEAANSAAAETGARAQTRQQGMDAMSSAVNMGNGMPASSSNMLSSAGYGVAGARNFYGQQQQYYGQQAGSAVTGAAKAIGGIANSQGFQNWMSGGASTSGGVTPPNPYYTDTVDTSGGVPGGYEYGGQTFNNPSAYVPSI